MITKARFLPYYRVIQSTLGKLVASLDDQAVMEYVSDDQMSVPIANTDAEPRPLPTIELGLGDEVIRLALVYGDAASLRHLKNLFHPTQSEAQRAFADSMRMLPVAFETRLSRRGFREEGFSVIKKYVASRVDASVLRLLVEEAEVIRAGGRRAVDGRSVYEAPATTMLSLLFVQVKVGDECREALTQMRRVIEVASTIKTQREMIHSRISKPVATSSRYRDFIELLNKARSNYVISADERRSLDKRWRDAPDERDVIEEDLRRRIGAT